MRLVLFAVTALALCACTPKQDAATPAGATMGCAGETLPTSGDACDLAVDGRTLRVSYGPLLEGVGGAVAIDVVGADGAVAQTLSEQGVSEYRYPETKDVDGDGHTDVLITHIVGNVNSEQAVWRQKADGKFVRVGEISGVDTSKTKDGLIAVPARGGASIWGVAFYRMDEEALTPIATVEVTATMSEDGGKIAKTACALTESPGIASLKLSAAAAEKKFCAEPAAAVFNE